MASCVVCVCDWAHTCVYIYGCIIECMDVSACVCTQPVKIINEKSCIVFHSCPRNSWLSRAMYYYMEQIHCSSCEILVLLLFFCFALFWGLVFLVLFLSKSKVVKPLGLKFKSNLQDLNSLLLRWRSFEESSTK